MDEVKPIKATGLVVVSPENKLIPQDIRAWGRKLLLFLYPQVTLYLGLVILAITKDIQDKTFVLKLDYLVPNILVVGGFIVYVLNGLLDLFNRWVSAVRYKVDPTA